MKKAYSNNGNSWRGIEDGWDIFPGEVVFDLDPTLGELDIAFPGRRSALAVAQWGRIKTERDRVKAGGVKVNVDGVDRWFHSDDTSRIQHLGLNDAARDLLAGGGAMPDRIQIDGADVLWKTMNGTFAYITAQLAFDIVAAAKVLDKKVFTAAETHKALMQASANPADYDFSAGWPPIYGEE